MGTVYQCDKSIVLKVVLRFAKAVSLFAVSKIFVGIDIFLSCVVIWIFNW